jgi:hypothetical protein
MSCVGDVNGACAGWRKAALARNAFAAAERHRTKPAALIWHRDYCCGINKLRRACACHNILNADVCSYGKAAMQAAVPFLRLFNNGGINNDTLLA